MSFGPYLAVAAGGALGALLRYGAGLALAPPPPAAGEPWPWPRATLGVNVLGCFVAGCALAWLTGQGTAQAAALGERREGLRLFLLVGLCGGFTTFSAFGVETVELMRRGQPGGAALYVALSLALGVAAVALGGALGGALLGRP